MIDYLIEDIHKNSFLMFLNEKSVCLSTFWLTTYVQMVGALLFESMNGAGWTEMICREW